MVAAFAVFCTVNVSPYFCRVFRGLSSEQILSLGDFCIGHGVATESSLFGLNADIGHRDFRCAFEVAVAFG